MRVGNADCAVVHSLVLTLAVAFVCPVLAGSARFLNQSRQMISGLNFLNSEWSHVRYDDPLALQSLQAIANAKGNYVALTFCWFQWDVDTPGACLFSVAGCSHFIACYNAQVPSTPILRRRATLSSRRSLISPTRMACRCSCALAWTLTGYVPASLVFACKLVLALTRRSQVELLL